MVELFGLTHRTANGQSPVFGEAKKVTRLPGRNPGLPPRQCSRIASPGKARAALSSLLLTFVGKLQTSKSTAASQ
jgi:hypothetical protein